MGVNVLQGVEGFLKRMFCSDLTIPPKPEVIWFFLVIRVCYFRNNVLGAVDITGAGAAVFAHGKCL